MSDSGIASMILVMIMYLALLFGLADGQENLYSMNDFGFRRFFGYAQLGLVVVLQIAHLAILLCVWPDVVKRLI